MALTLPRRISLQDLLRGLAERRNYTRVWTWPESLLVNRSGNVYVGGYNTAASSNSVTEYSSSGKFVLSLAGNMYPNIPDPLSLDSSNHIYYGYTSRSQGISQVNVVKGNATGPLRAVPANIPDLLAIDLDNNLYIANANNAIAVYAAGSAKLLRTITQGVDQPTAMAFDSKNNLYVANAGSNSIAVYDHDTKRLARTITAGIKAPSSLAFGSQ
jgi:YVTN family beta-propeller protein